MKKILSYITIGLLALFVASPFVALAAPAVSSVDAKCADRFLGIPTWYRGITVSDTDCAIQAVTGGSDAIGGFIWKIVLNIIEMALVIVVYIAVAFILYGGFLFMTGGGNPSMLQAARKTLLNAVIGLVIAMGAIAITNFVFGIVSTNVDSNGLPLGTGEELLTNILNIVYFIAGAVAVIMIVIAGLMYTTSSGDASKITNAKNMILYAIVGLVVILSAFAITNFVIGRF